MRHSDHGAPRRPAGPALWFRYLITMWRYLTGLLQ